MLIGSVLYEALIDATCTGILSDVILSAAEADIGVDEVFGYWFEEGTAPVRIVSAGRVGSSVARASLYSDRYHALDPLGWLASASTESGPTCSGRIVIGDVQNASYRLDCYERPGFWEKLSFARRRGGRHYVLSFYRNHDRRAATAGALAELAEMTFPLLRKQVDLLGDKADIPPLDRVAGRMERAFPLLTRRENQVCARTLIGMTAEAIALDLGVSETTVLTYRRRAYERYNISSAQEMIGKVLI